mgnify:CR=1 FL=1
MESVMEEFMKILFSILVLMIVGTGFVYAYPLTDSCSSFFRFHPIK